MEWSSIFAKYGAKSANQVWSVASSRLIALPARKTGRPSRIAFATPAISVVILCSTQHVFRFLSPEVAANSGVARCGAFCNLEPPVFVRGARPLERTSQSFVFSNGS
jgi:hypothetical protein